MILLIVIRENKLNAENEKLGIVTVSDSDDVLELELESVVVSVSWFTS